MSNYVSKEELEEFFEGIEITVVGRTRAEAVRDVLQAVYNGVMKLPTTDAVPVIRCKDCKHFELNHWETVDGVPLIVAHEICTKWGDGCKTSENGYCFMGERKDNG